MVDIEDASATMGVKRDCNFLLGPTPHPKRVPVLRTVAANPCVWPRLIARIKKSAIRILVERIIFCLLASATDIGGVMIMGRGFRLMDDWFL